MKTTLLSFVTVLTLLTSNFAFAQSSTVREVTAEVIANAKPAKKTTTGKAVEVKSDSTHAKDDSVKTETPAKTEAPKADAASTNASKQEDPACGTYRATKAEFDLAMKDLKETDRILQADREKLNRAWNKGIAAVSIGVPVSIFMSMGLKYYSNRVFLNGAELSQASLWSATAYGSILGGAIAVMLITTKDIVRMYGIIGDLQTQKKLEAADYDRLKKNIMSMMVNSGCR